MRLSAAQLISEISRAIFIAFASLLSLFDVLRALALATELNDKPAPFGKPCVRV
jgi:hypothetical protein